MFILGQKRFLRWARAQHKLSRLKDMKFIIDNELQRIEGGAGAIYNDGEP